MWHWVLAVLAIVLFTAPWVIIVGAPVVVLVACVTKLGFWGVSRSWEALRTQASVHHVGGLSDRRDLERDVRRAIRRTLRSVPGAPAIGCACVKPLDDRSHLGVLRLATREGHYLRTLVGQSRSEVACRIINTCTAMASAHGGTAEAVEISNCNPANCPVRWPFGSPDEATAPALAQGSHP